ncbi:MAG: hypothetical protein AAGJ83_06755 [Planctomycetota bacterium]
METITPSPVIAPTSDFRVSGPTTAKVQRGGSMSRLDEIDASMRWLRSRIRLDEAFLQTIGRQVAEQSAFVRNSMKHYGSAKL